MANKHMKICSISLLLGKCKLKWQENTIIQPLERVKLKRMTIPSIGKRLEVSYTAGGSVNEYIYFASQYLLKVRHLPTQCPTITFLDI